MPEQLEAITGSWPLHVDLLVVTHCHADHIVTALFDDRPLDGLSQQELRAVVEDGVKLWDSYKGMLDKLSTDGTKVVRYGVDERDALHRLPVWFEDDFDRYGRPEIWR